MIIDNKSSNVIGILRLSNPQVCNGLLEAVESQRLMSAYWRKGHMKEAKSFFYEHVFNTLGVDILYADVYEGNVNSIKSLEYYGYELIETNQGIFSKTGENCLVYIYALTKDNYDKTQKSR
jgi:RimJ/RimL family protein N-acetyltransferase